MMRSASALILLVALVPLRAQVEEKPVEKKEQAPKILALGERCDGNQTLLDIDGVPAKGSDLKGKVVVVNFYSIQCPIQRDWDTRLADLQATYQKDGVVFLHINSNHTEIGKSAPTPVDGEVAYDKVRAHLKERNLPFRVLVDHGNKVADYSDAKTTPHVYIFNRSGQLVYRGLVDDDQKGRNPDSRKNYVRDVLDKILQGKEFEPFSTKEVGCSIKRISNGEKPMRKGREGSGNDKND
jgi:peroxiredoxin